MLYIPWDSSVLVEPLPVSFHIEIEVFLKGYKREVAKAKKEGNVDKSSSDPIPIELLYLILT